MPRYYVTCYNGKRIRDYPVYCKADNQEQAFAAMTSYCGLFDLKLFSVSLSINQDDRVTDMDGPDFRTQPEPLPKEVTTDDQPSA